MIRYKLRTLLIVVALAPPVLAIAYWNWTITALLLAAALPFLGFVACWFDRGPIGPP